MNSLIWLIKHDLKISLRKRANIMNLLAFFLVIISLFPLSIGADGNVLHSIGSGIVWVAALLVSNLSLPRIFEEDFENGTLEQIMLSPVLPPFVILAKVIAHWVATGLPMLFISPFMVLMFGTETNIAIAMALSLLLGTPAISMIGIIGAALTVGIKRGGALVPLLVTPLYIPTLIFGTGLVESSVYGFASSQFITNAAGLLCCMLVALPLSIFGASYSLKIAMEE